jgi:hypothetical protein
VRRTWIIERVVDYDEMTAEKLIGKLERVGEYPAPELIDAVWERRAETEPLLLALFDDSVVFARDESGLSAGAAAGTL